MAVGLALVLALAAQSVAPGQLVAAYPGVEWSNEASMQVDIDGDGLPDRFGMGTAEGHAVVAIFLAGPAISRRLDFDDDFPCSAVSHGIGCDGAPRALEAVPLTDDAIKDLALVFDLETADIFAKGGRATAISVPMGDTDPFIFFWNAKSGQLDWLRL